MRSCRSGDQCIAQMKYPTRSVRDCPQPRCPFSLRSFHGKNAIFE